ncbi:ABC transporter substrate-binding protein, partial [Vibrio parahaemolyticus]|nr:ABC transporter substrate-binding protein [Vibrio parahaemolyticus]
MWRRDSLMMDMFALAGGTQLVHVPYRGSGPALSGAVAGQIPLISDNLPSALPFIKDKRLTALVVAAPQRLAVLPKVPTYAELSLFTNNDPSWFGLVAPAGTPAVVVRARRNAVAQALEEPAVRKALAD